MSKSAMEDVCRFRVDRAGYLRQFETVFLRPIRQGYDALPIGNGDLAAVVWQPGHLTWMLNKCDLSGEASQAARLVVETPTPLAERAGRLESRLSLAAARVTVRYRGGVVGDRPWRGNYAAPPEVKETDFGSLDVSAYVPHGRNVLLMDYVEKPKVPHRTRILFERWIQPTWGDRVDANVEAGFFVIYYVLRNGGSYAAALGWDGFPGATCRKDAPVRLALEVPATREVRGRVGIAVVNAQEADDPVQAAIGLVRDTLGHAPTKLRRAHEAAWRRFWDRSYVDAGHPYANALYHMALYELGISSRGRKPVKFNGALNLWNEQERSWGEGYTIHNQHSTHLPVYASNHVELADNFHDWIAGARLEAVKTARKYFGITGAHYPEFMSQEYEVPDPGTPYTDPRTWYGLCYILSSGTRLASLLWNRWRYTLDGTFLAEKAYPVIRDVATFYLNYGRLGDDGLYHVAPSQPWENLPIGRDAHSDCAAWRAIFRMAIEAAKELNVDQNLLPAWKDRLRKAPPYPTHHGVFSDVMRADGRAELPDHFAWQLPNLSGVFPYGVIGVDSPAPLRRTAEATFRRFQFNADAGHEYVPVIAARLGKAEWWRAALFQYIQFFQNFDQGLFNYYSSTGNKDEEYEANTSRLHCYLESSGVFATAVNEMLLQSHGGRIRVFPAVPRWWTARFILLAEGAFLVASEHRGLDGIPYIAIQPVGGEARPCRVVSPWKPSPRVTSSGRTMTAGRRGDIVDFAAEPGHVYVLSPPDRPPHRTTMEHIGFRQAHSPSRLGMVWYGNKEGANNHTVTFPLW
jgi:hypothetical protein